MLACCVWDASMVLSNELEPREMAYEPLASALSDNESS